MSAQNSKKNLVKLKSKTESKNKSTFESDSDKTRQIFNTYDEYNLNLDDELIKSKSGLKCCKCSKLYKNILYIVHILQVLITNVA
jgi:hypothetical protein